MSSRTRNHEKSLNVMCGDMPNRALNALFELITGNEKIARFQAIRSPQPG